MKINIRKIIKQNPILLAPMDDVTDIAFREIAEKNKASFSTTELTSIEALIRDKVSKERFHRGNLKINSVQLFGKNPLNFVKASKIIENEADIIDVNFGCPSPTVTKNLSGSYLLKDPPIVGDIISKLVNCTDKPITAKIRLGYKRQNYLEIAKEIENSGAEMIVVHGRTAKQKYFGDVDFNAIREIYENLNIVVIGNGNIKDIFDINKINEKCNGLMIGRAAIGNPFIFQEFNYFLKTGNRLEIKNRKELQKKLFFEYVNKISKLDFKNLNLKIQKQSMWFMKGIYGAKNLRLHISKTNDINEILNFIKEF